MVNQQYNSRESSQPVAGPSRQYAPDYASGNAIAGPSYYESEYYSRLQHNFREVNDNYTGDSNGDQLNEGELSAE